MTETGKTILITGCSSGIGYEVAHGLRAKGWHVFASCRKSEDCARLSAEGFSSPLIDYERPETITSGLAEVLEQTGGSLDALFNNGAYAIPGAVEDLPTDALRQIYEANVFGWHDLASAVIPVMRRQGQGRILQCSSVLGFAVMPWRGAYNSSKHALEGLTKTLRLEMRGTGIHVILIQPGPITSKIRANSIPHFERWVDWGSSPRAEQYRSTLLDRLYKNSGPDPFELPPSAVTDKVLRALTAPKPKARYMVTTPTYMMELFRRILPTSTLEWLSARG